MLMLPAFINHYPLVNPDTGTYLASGFKPETPFDRPITYGLLIRLFSINGLSLWPVVFAQGYLLSWLLLRVLRHVNANIPFWQQMAVLVFIATCTAASWLVSQIQPDLFTAIACLCIVLLLQPEKGAARVFIVTLFTISIAAHLSHPAMFIGLLALLWLCRRWYCPPHRYRAVGKSTLIMMALAAATVAIMGGALSKSKHVFFVATLLEKGVLKPYLDDACSTRHYPLCAYKDSLPKGFDDFVWNNGSPLYKTGDWKGSKKDYNAMIGDMLSRPKYIGMYALATLKETGQQLTTFHIGDGNFGFAPGSNVSDRIHEYFPREAQEFQNDGQNAHELYNQLQLPNLWLCMVVMISLIVACGGFMLRGKTLNPVVHLLYLVTGSCIIINSADCAAFAEVVGRYGAKMIWLIPFCALALVLQPKQTNN